MAWPLSESHCTVQPGMKISLYTMLQQIQYFIIITQCLLQVVFCQRIQLFPYNETKNCNINLVEKEDRIVMYGKVDFNGNILASSLVNFEIKRKTEMNFHFISFLSIPQDCDKEFYYGNCLKTDDHKVFILYLNITAHEVTSEADIRAELVYRETTFYSEIRKLPIVYDFQTDIVAVYANDQVVLFKQTEVSINDTDATLLATCREKFAKDCKLQLTDLENGVLLKSGKEIVVYNTHIKGRSNLNLKYSVCNFERNISFSITTNVHLTTETDLILIIIASVTLILAMMFGCFYNPRFSKYIHGDKKNFSGDTTGLQQYRPLTGNENVPRNVKGLECIYENAKKSNYIKHLDPIYSHQKKSTVDLTNVPIRYRENEFINLLEIVSLLSCRVAFGGGLVTNILKYFCGVGINTLKRSQSHACPCPKCLKSKSPSDTWAEIFITTSSSILKNKNYHKQITCVLSTEDNVTTELRDLSVEHKDPEKSGRCLLKYVTCDETLFYKLQVLLEERARLEEKVQEIFHQHKGHDKIYFALVHREDGTKQICTGTWSERNTKYNVRTYHYDPEIPIGNIGAPVVLMGYGHGDNECNLMRNFLGEVLCNNFSTSVFSTEIVQKIKKPIS